MKALPIPIDKVPPQAQDLELAVLGAILLEKDSLYKVIEFLRPESFYNEVNANIYKAIQSLFQKNQPIDILTVTQELKKLGELENCGGAYFITKLTDYATDTFNIEFHARIIEQKYIQRELVLIGHKLISDAYNESSDVFDTIDSHEKRLTDLSKNYSTSKVHTFSDLMVKIKEHNKILISNKGLVGVPSGYYELDSITGGFQNSDLIIIAARPAMGKTSLVCNMFRNASVDFNKPGILFSLEMSALQLATRILSLETKIPTYDFTVKGIEPDRMVFVEKDCKRLLNSQFFIDDTPGISLRELRSKARELKRKKNIQWIAVDYLQLMKGQGQNREQEIASISRGLKGLAKELNIPVVALSQLSRSVEQRGGDKRPQLSDLRESGAIEQDADMVMFIHRPEYYGITEYSNGESAVGIAEIIFAKNRKGAIGTEKLKWIDYLTKFESLSELF